MSRTLKNNKREKYTCYQRGFIREGNITNQTRFGLIRLRRLKHKRIRQSMKKEIQLYLLDYEK